MTREILQKLFVKFLVIDKSFRQETLHGTRLTDKKNYYTIGIMVERNIKPVITIEDHPDIREGLKKLMIECGLGESQLFFTQNPTDARKVLENILTPPGLILIDIGVSNRNEGFSFLDWVKAEESPLKDIPVIVISADAREDTRKAAVEKGASEFIGQPFELNIMMTAVKKHLRMEN